MILLQKFPRDKSGKREIPNNPWREAYAHASQYDVGTAKKFVRTLKLSPMILRMENFARLKNSTQCLVEQYSCQAFGPRRIMIAY